MTASSHPGGRPVRLVLALFAATLALTVWAGPAAATTRTQGARVITVAAHTKSTNAAIPGTPVLVTTPNKPPSGYTLTASKVLRIALRDPRVKAELRKHPKLLAYEYTKGAGTWQVSWFSPGRHEKETMQAYVDDQTGTVTQVWTGYQVAWSMARGYPGAFGRRVNAVYVWLPLCLLFIAPFFPLPWRRRLGGPRARRRPRRVDQPVLAG